MRRVLGPVDLAPLPTLLFVLAALAVAVGGFEHAYLYHDGYSEISTIGTLFMVNAIGSLLTILALIARRPLLFVAGSLSISIGSIVALLLTRTTGLFGFQESGYDGHALLTLLAEIAAVPLTLVGAILAGSALVGEGTERARAMRPSSDPALRLLTAVVTTLVLGAAIVGVGRGGDEVAPQGGNGTTTTAPGQTETAPGTAEPEQATLAAGVADRSRALFSDRCAGCHRLADADATGRIGPDLDQVLPGRPSAKVLEDLVDPEAETTPGFPSGRMPSFEGQLSQQQLDELVEYLIAVTPNG